MTSFQEQCLLRGKTHLIGCVYKLNNMAELTAAQRFLLPLKTIREYSISIQLLSGTIYHECKGNSHKHEILYQFLNSKGNLHFQTNSMTMDETHSGYCGNSLNLKISIDRSNRQWRQRTRQSLASCYRH